MNNLTRLLLWLSCYVGHNYKSENKKRIFHLVKIGVYFTPKNFITWVYSTSVKTLLIKKQKTTNTVYKLYFYMFTGNEKDKVCRTKTEWKLFILYSVLNILENF